MSSPSNISSPTSTGGAGNNFEVKVQASFLASMIVRAPCPCLPDSDIEEVHFQVKRLGNETDDLLVKTRTQDGTKHKLLCQITRQVNFTQSDEKFKKTLCAAWKDFHSEKFSKENDAIALITGSLSKKEINHFRSLMEWARTSDNSNSFFKKIDTPRYASEEKRKFISTIKNILTESSELSKNDDTIWQFLKIFHLLSYDFDVDDSQYEATTLHMLQMAKDINCNEAPQNLWLQITELARRHNEKGGEISYSNLGEKLSEPLKIAFSHSPHLRASRSLDRLKEHSQITLDSIQDEFTPQVNLPRTEVIDEIIDKLEQEQLFIITGEAGIGKSVIAKQAAYRLKKEGCPVFAFRAEEFDHPHLHQALTAMGVTDSVQDIAARFGLLPRCLFIIDSIERVFECNHNEAFIQFMQTINKNPAWRIMLVCRSENVSNLASIITQQLSSMQIPRLSKEEIHQVSNKIPNISSFINEPQVNEVIKTPFYLKLLVNFNDALTNLSPQQIKQKLWRVAVEKPTKQQNGMPQRRRESFVEIAVKRATNMARFVRIDGIDAGAVQQLCNDGILLHDDQSNYAPAHDLFEDLALYEHIEKCRDSANGNWKQFLEALSEAPALRRSFRNWLTNAISDDRENIYSFALEAFKNEQIPQHWQEEIIVGILKSETNAPDKFIEHFSDPLLENNKQLFKQFIHLLRVGCRGPNKQMNLFIASDPQLKQFWEISFSSPTGRGWEAIIHFIATHLDRFGFEEGNLVESVLSDWVGSLNLNTSLPLETKDCFNIALKYFNFLTDENKDFYAGDLPNKYLKIMLKIPNANQEAILKLYEPFINNNVEREKNSHPFYSDITNMFKKDRLLAEHAIQWDSWPQLCQYFPKIPLAVLNYALSSFNPKRRMSYDMEPYFGLHSEFFGVSKFHPASKLQGPFLYLLLSHPEQSIAFLIEFFNKTCEAYAQSALDETIPQIPLKFNGTERHIYANQRLWQMYRGTSTAPYILESALMALEAWLLDKAKKGEDIMPYIKQIFEQTNSVVLIAPLVSVALAYPNAFKENLLPLFATPEFYMLDQIRYISDQSHISDLRPMLEIPKRLEESVFINERKESDALPHRSNHLEDLVRHVQASYLRDEIYQVIDKMKLEVSKLPPETEDSLFKEALLKRIDWREYEPIGKDDKGNTLMQLKDLSPELQERSEQAQKNEDGMRRIMKLQRWTEEILDNKKNNTFQNWQEALKEVEKISQLLDKKNIQDPSNMWANYNPPTWMASLLIRDYRNELDEGQTQWCISKVLSSLEGQIDDSTPMLDITHGSRPAAKVLPLLLDICAENQKKQIYDTIIRTLTSANQSICEHAVAGSQEWLWQIDENFVNRCFLGLLELAQYRTQWHEEQRQIPLFERTHIEPDWLKPNREIRNKLIAGEAIDIDITSLHLDLSNHWDIIPALNIVPLEKIDDGYIQLVANILNDFAQDREGNLYEFKYKFAQIFASLIMQLENNNAPNKNLLDALKNVAEKEHDIASNILDELIIKEEAQTSGEKFWTIWNELADIILHEKTNEELLRAYLFTGQLMAWKKEIKTWKPLQEHPQIIQKAFDAVGHTPKGFSTLLQMITTIGNFSIPSILINLSNALERSAGKNNMLNGHNTKFNLEVVLRNSILSHKHDELRSNPRLREAALRLLNHLIDNGSTTAHQLRDIL